MSGNWGYFWMPIVLNTHASCIYIYIYKLTIIAYSNDDDRCYTLYKDC